MKDGPSQSHTPSGSVQRNLQQLPLQLPPPPPSKTEGQGEEKEVKSLEARENIVNSNDSPKSNIIEEKGHNGVINRSENASQKASKRGVLLSSFSSLSVTSRHLGWIPRVTLPELDDPRTAEFASTALLCLPRKNFLRRFVTWIVLSPEFDQFIFAVIIYNTVLLGFADYGNVYTDPSDCNKPLGDLDPRGSLCNKLLLGSEEPLAYIYAMEALIKIMAMGFLNYLVNYWNQLDFIVSVAGLIQVALAGYTCGRGANLSFLRIFRVLRPLRSLSHFSGMKVVVDATAGAVPRLAAVLALVAFAFLLFGIMAVQLFAGSLHARCRLTPFPVKANWTVGDDYDTFRCLPDGINFDTIDEHVNWLKSDSPWSTPQRHCFWPIDEDDTRVCSLGDNLGLHQCVHGTDRIHESEWRWCGSNYDALGNPRFSGSKGHPGSKSYVWFEFYNESIGGKRLMEMGTYVEDLNWGLTNFDSFPAAVITIFQIITLEGWAHIAYMAMDAYGGGWALFFNTIVLVGSFFVLNLVLAVLEDAFTKSRDYALESSLEAKIDISKEYHKEAIVAEAALSPMDSLVGFDQEDGDRANDMPHLEDARNMEARTTFHSASLPSPASQHAMSKLDLRAARSIQNDELHSLRHCDEGIPNNRDLGETSSMVRLASRTSMVDSRSDRPVSAFEKLKRHFTAKLVRFLDRLAAWGESPPKQACRRWLKNHVVAPSPTGSWYDGWFDKAVLVLIVVNTATLMCDRWPMTNNEQYWLEVINFCLTALFSLEMAMKILALGCYLYWCDASNALDGFIVIASIAELALSPPEFLSGESTKAGAITALRCFRLFRIFKLSREWKSMHELLDKFIATFWDVSNVAFLCFLLAYIFSLLGMQLYANVLKFDDKGYPIKIDAEGAWATTPSERANFDNFLWSFVTVFQILTGEDWQQVLYACWRASGFGAVIYFFLLIIIGMFIILNLFLAILLSNFSAKADERRRVEMAVENASQTIIGMTSPHSREHLDHILQPYEAETADAGNDYPLDIESEPKDSPRYQYVSRRSTGPRTTSEEKDIDTQGGAPAMTNDDLEQESGENDFENNSFDWSGAMFSDEGAALPSDFVMIGSGGNKSPISEDDLVISAPARESEIEKVIKELDNSYTSDSTRRVDGRRRSFTLSGATRVTTSGINNIRTSRSLSDASSSSPSRLRERLAKRESEPTTLSRSIQHVPVETEHENKWSSPGTFKRDHETLGEKEVELLNYDAVFPLEVGRTLGIFSETNPLRLICAELASSPWFERTTMCFIALSSVALALDSPLDDPKSDLVSVLRVLDFVFTLYFLMEMLIKIVVSGVYFMSRAYLRDAFNCLDGAIVAISIAGVVVEFSGGGGANSSLRSFRSLRALRAIRPLRVIKRLENLKLVVNSIINVIPDVLNVLLLCLLFYIMFGVVFVQYFKGAFLACSGDAFEEMINHFGQKLDNMITNPVSWYSIDAIDRMEWFGVENTTDEMLSCGTVTSGPCCPQWPLNLHRKPTSKEVCRCLELDWEKSVSQSFDNIGAAILSLFELSTTEGWVSVVHACVDARGIDKQPVRDHAPAWAIFILIFMLIGHFFFMNLFVGVLYERFTDMQKELKGRTLFLNQKQHDLIDAQKLGLRFKPLKKLRPPDDRLGRAAFAIIFPPSSPHLFEGIIMCCIISNTIVMALAYFGMGSTYSVVLETLNFGFAIIYTIEAVLKLAALRLDYFSNDWNKFDLTIVLGTIGGFAVKLSGGGSGGAFIISLRTFRLARILRLIKGAKALREIFLSLYFTAVGLLNVFGLLFLLLFVYTVMGVQLFATVQYNGDLNEHANFRNFGTAMLTLFRFTTGENWNGFMHDASVKQPGCEKNPLYDDEMCGFHDHPGCIPLNGCGTQSIFPFLYSFCIFVTVVALNLFVGVILSGFAQAGESGHLLRPEDFERFQQIWLEYDEDGTAFIDTVRLLHMLQHIEEPWGFGKKYRAGMKELKERIVKLDLPVYHPSRLELFQNSGRVQVYYYDVFLALTNHAATRAIRKSTDKISGTYHSDGALGAMARISAAAVKAADDAAASLRALREQKLMELQEVMRLENEMSKTCVLTVSVNVISASELMAADKNGTSDPYAIAELIETTTGKPLKKGYRAKTHVVKKTLNPVWCEGGQDASSWLAVWTDVELTRAEMDAAYMLGLVPRENNENETVKEGERSLTSSEPGPANVEVGSSVSLRVRVLDDDFMSIDDLLGEAIIPLSSAVVSDPETSVKASWSPLKESGKMKDGSAKGRVQIHLRCAVSRGSSQSSALSFSSISAAIGMSGTIAMHGGGALFGSIRTGLSSFNVLPFNSGGASRSNSDCDLDRSQLKGRARQTLPPLSLPPSSLPSQSSSQISSESPVCRLSLPRKRPPKQSEAQKDFKEDNSITSVSDNTWESDTASVATDVEEDNYDSDNWDDKEEMDVRDHREMVRIRQAIQRMCTRKRLHMYMSSKDHYTVLHDFAARTIQQLLPWDGNRHYGSGVFGRDVSLLETVANLMKSNKHIGLSYSPRPGRKSLTSPHSHGNIGKEKNSSSHSNALNKSKHPLQQETYGEVRIIANKLKDSRGGTLRFYTHTGHMPQRKLSEQSMSAPNSSWKRKTETSLHAHELKAKSEQEMTAVGSGAIRMHSKMTMSLGYEGNL